MANTDTVKFTTVTHEEWEQLPVPTPTKPKDRFDPLLASISQGEIVKVEVEEEKEIKGIRIAIARKARNLGFVTEFRTQATSLFIKRSDKPLTPTPKKAKTEHKEETTRGTK